jgi:hypothetical protein
MRVLDVVFDRMIHAHHAERVLWTTNVPLGAIMLCSIRPEDAP